MSAYVDPLVRAVDSAAHRKALQAAFDRGYRKGKIEARAELTAIWRNRLTDVLAILNAPIPAPQKDDK